MKFKFKNFYFYDEGQSEDIINGLREQVETLQSQVKTLQDKNDDSLKDIIANLIKSIDKINSDIEKVKEATTKKEEKETEAERLERERIEREKKEKEKLDDSKMPEWYRVEKEKERTKALNNLKVLLMAKFTDFADEINACEDEDELNRLEKTITKASEKAEKVTEEKALEILKSKDKAWQDQRGLSYKKKEEEKGKENKTEKFMNKFRKKR